MSMLLHRLYSTSPMTKVPIALIAELRKQTQVSLPKAREALSHSGGSIPGALAWLEKDLISTGAQKAAKVSSRETKEGLIAQSVLSSTSLPNTHTHTHTHPKVGKGVDEGAGGSSVRAALVELNCETDFVARNQLFATLAADIAHTVAFLSESSSSSSSSHIPLHQIHDFPLIPHLSPNTHSPRTTIASAIRDTIVKVGENISLRRARALVRSLALPSPTESESQPESHKTKIKNSILRLASYTHSPLHGLQTGPTSALALLKITSPALFSLLLAATPSTLTVNPSAPTQSFIQNLGVLERSLARQLVAFPTRFIHPSSSPSITSPEEEALLAQPFITLADPELNGKPVSEVLRLWAAKNGLSDADGGDAIEVLEFVKWSVGEPLVEEGEREKKA